MGDIENVIKNNPFNKLSFKGISLLGLIATAAYGVAYITYLVEFAEVSWRYVLTHMIYTDIILWFGMAASSVFYLTDFFRHKMKKSGFLRSDFQGIFTIQI